MGCDVDSEVQSVAVPDLVLTLAFQMLNPKLDISGSGEVEAAGTVWTDKMGARLPRKKAVV